ncbi:type B DNA-directed DNA polymerase [Methanospirillum lacunae]|uniref:DNA-directed DNA polymerase n=1 Tax=Methanospirillum lacunae TaxID=668570 RepID=A0A2V2MNN0_9EURY|nr:type B DNA-directed DNA polymerase [Methanospirillum lacunae]PWR69844.1 DNA polymerase I [Methanospirillum lacunae]
MSSSGTFILDSCRTKKGISFWQITDGRLEITHHTYSPSFLIHFREPDLHRTVIEELHSTYGIAECSFRSIYEEYQGYKVDAGREVAEEIEKQTNYKVSLFNVDIRPEQQFAAEHAIVPGGICGVDRFNPVHEFPGTTMEIAFSENPHRSEHTGTISVTDLDRQRPYILEGSDRQNIDDLCDIVQTCDPDLILFPDYDRWSSYICDLADKWGIVNTLSRTGRFRRLSSRSYFSYGRMEHRLGAMVPEGRVIVDTRQSFMYREGDARGIFLASRLSGLSPNLTCRLTPGTLVSSYEVYEALARGIAVPFRKNDAEAHRRIEDMRLDYRGGLTLQPQPGIYEDVTQIDFTSFYPSIIVKYNLSPETLKYPEKTGFLASVLRPILDLRQITKQRKRVDPTYAGMDGILKWMLVTCFGYTGYKNARFGRIEVHEQITLRATELLQECVSTIGDLRGRVLHAIIDCLFIQECDPLKAQFEIEKLTDIKTEIEQYDWIVFLPQIDGTGSYGNYYGRLMNGKIKARGVAARRRNTPAYIRQMQEAMLTLMAHEHEVNAIASHWSEVRDLYRQYSNGLRDADPRDLVIKRRIGKERYQNKCIPQAVIDVYRQYGVELVPGMDASFIVRDEKGLLVDPSFDPKGIDARYYQRLLDRAWKEIEFVHKVSETY